METISFLLRVFKTVRLFFMFAFLCSLLACAGGGSSGTGGRTFAGTLRSSNGDPLSGITVTVAETGETTITDEQGAYTIQSDAEESAVSLEFNSESVEASYTLDNLPIGPAVIEADFEIEEENDEVVLNSLQIYEEEQDSSDGSDAVGADDDEEDSAASNGNPDDSEDDEASESNSADNDPEDEEQGDNEQSSDSVICSSDGTCEDTANAEEHGETDSGEDNGVDEVDEGQSEPNPGEL